MSYPARRPAEYEGHWTINRLRQIADRRVLTTLEMTPGERAAMEAVLKLYEEEAGPRT